MKIRQTALAELKPYPENFNKHSKEQIYKLAKMIEKFGWRQPIVVDENMEIIMGHGRYEAAELLKLKKVPVHIAEGMSAEDAKALRLADNRIARESEFDTDLIEKELRELEKLGFDLALTAFDENELDRLLAELEEELSAELTKENETDNQSNEIDDPGEKKIKCTCPHCGKSFNLETEN